MRRREFIKLLAGTAVALPVGGSFATAIHLDDRVFQHLS
jgi:hypothetical protein